MSLSLMRVFVFVVALAWLLCVCACICVCGVCVCLVGLLLSSFRENNPVIFFEPKRLYRASTEDVPVGDYEIPLGTAEVVRAGSDVTVVAWGAQVGVVEEVSELPSRWIGELAARCAYCPAGSKTRWQAGKTQSGRPDWQAQGSSDSSQTEEWVVLCAGGPAA
jgi:hypothetical protein